MTGTAQRTVENMSFSKANPNLSILEICQEMIEAAKADDLPRVEAASAAYWEARSREVADHIQTIH
jgi:hypothetical protein